MTLDQWINKVPQKTLAKKLGVNAATIHYWTIYSSLPRPEMMREIKRLSRGKVTYDSMIESYLKARKNRKK